MKNDEFYIGYLPKMPGPLARFIKAFAALTFAVVLGTVAAVWFGQKPFAGSFFEFSTERVLEGTIQARPIPFLLVDEGEQLAGLPLIARIPLVGEGKHGISPEIRNLDGQRVRLKGKLIYRDEQRMIEVVSGSVEALAADRIAPPNETESLGRQSLRGEIIDSKCYLGVMNPGHTKPHRECAVRCLSGGVPPLFLVRDGEGNSAQLWLIAAEGESLLPAILDYVAEPVELSGEVLRTGDQLFFKINSRQIKRIN